MPITIKEDSDDEFFQAPKNLPLDQPLVDCLIEQRQLKEARKKWPEL